jgi:glutamate-1-semialdehyde 2,1-aminomutase
MEAYAVTQAGTSTSESERLYDVARRYLPGGVSAAARFHPALGRPFFAARGEGARLWDVDGREYLDFHMSFGAGLLGHGHPAIKAAVERALDMGILCAFETEVHGETARKITELVPCAELVRFTGSGTETTWHAVRTARVFTGRWKIVKFEGHFHGFSDVLGYSSWPPLDMAGPPDAPARIPESAGIPPADAEAVIVLPWNDVDALERCLRAQGREIAAVIMEPINYNSGGILPAPGYLAAARELTARHGVVLIFDEILSGFRTGASCAQGYFGVTPDLCTLGKCLGGGTPLSAFAGRRDIMEACAPIGKGVHSGTYNAHPIPVIAANAFLDVVADPAFWEDMRAKEAVFYPGLREAFARAGVKVWVQATGARFNLLFGLDREPTSYREAARCDRKQEVAFYRAALERGIYFHYSWHHGFSALHTSADLEFALAEIEAAARSIAQPG